MFEIENIQEIVAERYLHLEDQADSSVRVILGKPRTDPIAPSDHVLCPYQILGIGDEKVRSASGVDAFQALQLAMEMIGAELYFKLNRQYGGKLRWEGGREGDLGFPVPPGLEGEK